MSSQGRIQPGSVKSGRVRPLTNQNAESTLNRRRTSNASPFPSSINSFLNNLRRSIPNIGLGFGVKLDGQSGSNSNNNNDQNSNDFFGPISQFLSASRSRTRTRTRARTDPPPTRPLPTQPLPTQPTRLPPTRRQNSRRRFRATRPPPTRPIPTQPLPPTRRPNARRRFRGTRPPLTRAFPTQPLPTRPLPTQPLPPTRPLPTQPLPTQPLRAVGQSFNAQSNVQRPNSQFSQGVPLNNGNIQFAQRQSGMIMPMTNQIPSSGVGQQSNFPGFNTPVQPINGLVQPLPPPPVQIQTQTPQFANNQRFMPNTMGISQQTMQVNPIAAPPLIQNAGNTLNQNQLQAIPFQQQSGQFNVQQPQTIMTAQVPNTNFVQTPQLVQANGVMQQSGMIQPIGLAQSGGGIQQSGMVQPSGIMQNVGGIQSGMTQQTGIIQPGAVQQTGVVQQQTGLTQQGTLLQQRQPQQTFTMAGMGAAQSGIAVQPFMQTQQQTNVQRQILPGQQSIQNQIPNFNLQMPIAQQMQGQNLGQQLAQQLLFSQMTGQPFPQQLTFQNQPQELEVIDTHPGLVQSMAGQGVPIANRPIDSTRMTLQPQLSGVQGIPIPTTPSPLIGQIVAPATVATNSTTGKKNIIHIDPNSLGLKLVPDGKGGIKVINISATANPTNTGPKNVNDGGLGGASNPPSKFVTHSPILTATMLGMDVKNSTDIPEELEINGTSYDSPHDMNGKPHPLDTGQALTKNEPSLTPSASSHVDVANGIIPTNMLGMDRPNTTDIPEEIEINGTSLDSPHDRNGPSSSSNGYNSNPNVISFTEEGDFGNGNGGININFHLGPTPPPMFFNDFGGNTNPQFYGDWAGNSNPSFFGETSGKSYGGSYSDYGKGYGNSYDNGISGSELSLLGQIDQYQPDGNGKSLSELQTLANFNEVQKNSNNPLAEMANLNEVQQNSNNPVAEVMNALDQENNNNNNNNMNDMIKLMAATSNKNPFSSVGNDIAKLSSQNMMMNALIPKIPKNNTTQESGIKSLDYGFQIENQPFSPVSRTNDKRKEKSLSGFVSNGEFFATNGIPNLKPANNLSMKQNSMGKSALDTAIGAKISRMADNALSSTAAKNVNDIVNAKVKDVVERKVTLQMLDTIDSFLTQKIDSLLNVSDKTSTPPTNLPLRMTPPTIGNRPSPTSTLPPIIPPTMPPALPPSIGEMPPQYGLMRKTSSSSSATKKFQQDIQVFLSQGKSASPADNMVNQNQATESTPRYSVIFAKRNKNSGNVRKSSNLDKVIGYTLRNFHKKRNPFGQPTKKDLFHSTFDRLKNLKTLKLNNGSKLSFSPA